MFAAGGWGELGTGDPHPRPVVAAIGWKRANHSVLVECKVVQGVDHEPETLWHFAMFSRPPPVETL